MRKVSKRDVTVRNQDKHQRGTGEHSDELKDIEHLERIIEISAYGI
jgi:hypothetical protein